MKTLRFEVEGAVTEIVWRNVRAIHRHLDMTMFDIGVKMIVRLNVSKVLREIGRAMIERDDVYYPLQAIVAVDDYTAFMSNGDTTLLSDQELDQWHKYREALDGHAR